MNFSYHFDGGALQLIHSEEIMKLSLYILSLFFSQAPSFALGDKSVLPASSDAMTNTVRALNQVHPEEVEEEIEREQAEEEQAVLGTQDVQEKQYQEDQRREMRQDLR